MSGLDFVSLREAGRWASDESLRLYLDQVAVVEVKYTTDGAIRPPYKIQEAAKDMVFVRESVFADDTATMDCSWQRFQEAAILLDETISAFGGELNAKETEWMCISGAGPDPDLAPLPGCEILRVRGQPIPRTYEFCYIGSVLGASAALGVEEDGRRRIGLA